VDIVRDNLGDNRSTYPATLYAVAGTQAGQGHEKENELSIFKLSSLSRTQKDNEGLESEDDSDDEDEESDPILESKLIPLTSCTNRIRSFQRPRQGGPGFAPTFTASMMESGQVLIHDITPHLNSFDSPGTSIAPQQNLPYVITAHKSTEGYAVDWSPLSNEGKLLTGDTKGRIFSTIAKQGGGWEVDRKDPFTGHSGSVEELQWSPTEASVFASASSDGTVKIWDTRSKSRKSKVSVRASDYDVNVLSWSRQTSHLLASGHDDGSWAVWDLRQWRPNSSSGPSKQTPVADFHFNKEQITCLEWHPTDDSIIMACAGDSTVTLWDLAVELDDEESKETGGVKEYPPQLLFVHWQEGVKEGHWHPQIPGMVVSTGMDGFDVFKTISV
jgi:ribosome assembly protein RRB1